MPFSTQTVGVVRSSLGPTRYFSIKLETNYITLTISRCDSDYAVCSRLVTLRTEADCRLCHVATVVVLASLAVTLHRVHRVHRVHIHSIEHAEELYSDPQRQVLALSQYCRVPKNWRRGGGGGGSAS